jgi:hypothetical protein
MTLQLISLFETGFKTVTACRNAVECFVKVKKDYVLRGGFSFARLCFSAFNLAVLAEVAEDAATTVSPGLSAIAGAQLLFSGAQLLYSGYKAVQSHKEQKKWSRGTYFPRITPLEVS